LVIPTELADRTLGRTTIEQLVARVRRKRPARPARDGQNRTWDGSYWKICTITLGSEVLSAVVVLFGQRTLFGAPGPQRWFEAGDALVCMHEEWISPAEFEEL
jgi:hypothetical protein